MLAVMDVAALDRISRRRWLAAILACAALPGGCFWSDDDVAPAALPEPAAVRLADGRVTTVGTLSVGGVVFSGSPQVVRQGAAASADALAPGQRVEVEGSVDGGLTVVAQRVVIRTAVHGIVDQVSATRGRPEVGALVVLGQRVVVDDDTVTAAGMAIDDGLRGRAVDVHGDRSVDGSIRATRIALAQPDGALTGLSGPVASVDATDGSFTIDRLRVTTAAAAMEGFGAGGVAIGDWVEVVAASPPTADTLRAGIVTRLSRGVVADDGTPVVVSGLVESWTGLGDLVVAGQRVDARSAAMDGGEAAEIAVGTRLDVRGRIDAGGVLQAAAVTVHPGGIEEILSAAYIPASDARTVLVLEGRFAYVPLGAVLSDARPGGVALAGFDAIAHGDILRLRGRMSGRRFVANSVERVDGLSYNVLARGSVTHAHLAGDTVIMNFGDLRIEGSGPSYQDWDGNPMSAARFAAAAQLGVAVEVAGNPTHGVIQSRAVRLIGPLRRVVGINAGDGAAQVLGVATPAPAGGIRLEELRTGMVTHLKVPLAQEGVAPTLVSWSAPPQVWGKVTAVSGADLSVLYQPLTTDAATLLEPAMPTDADVVAKRVYEIHGLRDFDRGVVQATLVRARDDPADRNTLARGVVRAFDATARRFYLNGLMAYGWLDMDVIGLPAGASLGDGVWIQVQEGRVRDDDAVQPTRIDVLPPGLGAGEGDSVLFEGLVSMVRSATRFSVGNQAIDASAATFEGMGPPRSAASGDRVAVVGRVRFGEVLAERVTFQR